MGSEKRNAWWNLEVKEAIRAKKLSLDLQLPYSAACKAVATIVKQSKEKSCEEFEKKLDTDYR